MSDKKLKNNLNQLQDAVKEYEKAMKSVSVVIEKLPEKEKQTLSSTLERLKKSASSQDINELTKVMADLSKFASQ